MSQARYSAVQEHIIYGLSASLSNLYLKINSQAIKLYKKAVFFTLGLDIKAVKATKNKQMFTSNMSLFKVNYVWHSTVYLWYIQRFLA